MGIFYALVAALFIPLTNLFMRRSFDAGGTTKTFFVFQMAASFTLAVLIHPLPKGDFSINAPIACLGIVAGLILSVMLFSLGKAVEKGPPGLTFSILNSATVMPGLLMALIFGSAFGFIYNAWHGIGSLLVLAGLFWAGKGLEGMKEKRAWILLCVTTFCMHVLLLSLYQWRALLLNLPHPEELISFFTQEKIHSEWFVPFMFLSCGIVQVSIYLKAERRKPKPLEMAYGIAGGVSNILCTFFIIWATEVANPLEQAIIFPIFSVVGIILTNAWGQKLYQEQVNWRACQLCAFGLIVGTVDWKAVSASIGF